MWQVARYGRRSGAVDDHRVARLAVYAHRAGQGCPGGVRTGDGAAVLAFGSGERCTRRSPVGWRYTGSEPSIPRAVDDAYAVPVQ